MTSDWVAVCTRGRGLQSRRVGRDGALQLASMPTVAAAVAALTHTPYGRDVRTGMDLGAAQHAVCATLLWHLRILAGWSRPSGAERVRRLAAGFEIANVTAKVARLTGRVAPPPFELGALTVGWRRFAGSTSIADLRRRLASSAWGDPGSDDLGAIRVVLLLEWIAQVAVRVPEAREWALAYAAIVRARIAAGGAPAGEAIATRLHALLGDGLPRHVAWVLDAAGIAGGLWQAEARWWARVESDARLLSARPLPEPGTVVGMAALLAVDARRVCIALELAARGGADAREWFDAVA